MSLLHGLSLLGCGNAGLAERPDLSDPGDTAVDSGASGDTGDGSDPDDTGQGNRDDPSDLPNAGKTGGLVQYQLVQIACPECLNYTSDLQVSAMAGFHAATKKSWVDWLPSEGSCVTNPAPSAASDDWQDAGEWLSYRSGATSVQLRLAGGLYSADGLDEGDFIRNAAWELDTEGGTEVDDFAVESAFYTPEAISELEPAEMLYTRPSDAFAARISASRADFSWGPYGGSDQFAIVLDVYNSGGTKFLGEVFCLEADAGEMRIPSSYLSGYPAGSLLVIGMYRYVVGAFDRPDDGSTVETVVNFGVIGTGQLVN